MEDSLLPDEAQRLVTETLASMDHVEALFHLRRRGGRTAAELAAAARIHPTLLQRVLLDLTSAKLVVEQHGTFELTDTPRDRAAIDELVEVYNRRPVTLVRAVYGRPAAAKRFTDAFRLPADE